METDYLSMCKNFYAATKIPVTLLKGKYAVYTSFNDVNILINSELCNNIQSLLTQKTCYTWYSLRSALNRRSLCSGFSCIPSTIITRSRHSMG